MLNCFILKKKLSPPNEIVLGKEKVDDRREIQNNKSGNNFIYLGTKKNFTARVSEYISQDVIDDLYDNFEAQKEGKEKGKGAMQAQTGILVEHKIDLNYLKLHIPFINKYLIKFKKLYKNPNFKEAENLRKTDNYLNLSTDLSFFSDLVFISDNSVGKPYFKWFRDSSKGDHSKKEKFDFLKEFLIPKITFWNFKIVSFSDNVLSVRWYLSYSDIIYTTLNNKKLTEEAKEFLIERALFNIFKLDEESDIETVKDAIVKVRINQSKFRKDLLKSKRNACLFTKITDPQRLLIAGHIRPWRESSHNERLNINNGILLTPTFDKLFDKFLISFDEDGNLIYSNKLEGIWEQLFPRTETIKKTTFKITDANRQYLDYHRNKFKEQNDKDENTNK